VVLSHSVWQHRFGADPRVVGTTILLNRHPFTVVGVAPGSFHRHRGDRPPPARGQQVPRDDHLAFPQA
jgi:hypothetical protein